MIDTKSYPDNIPFAAYGMIAITSLVLAYATIMDIDKNKDTTSATSMLPSIIPPTQENQLDNLNENIDIEEESTEIPGVTEPVIGVPVVPVSPIVPPPLDQLNKINPEPTAPIAQAVPVAEKVGGKSKKSKKSKKRSRKHKN